MGGLGYLIRAKGNRQPEGLAWDPVEMGAEYRKDQIVTKVKVKGPYICGTTNATKQGGECAKTAI